MYFCKAALLFMVFGCSLSAVRSIKGHSKWANKQADIYFLVDSSASVWILDYIKMLQFVASLVSEMDIGPSGTRVGVGVFSGDHKLYIPVDNNFTKDKLIGEIVKAPHLKGVTFLSRALKGMLDQGLSSSVTRPGVPQITVLLTDGMSRHKQLTADNATLAKEAGISIFTIGIGNRVDQDELRDIASDPKSRFNYHVLNFDNLDDISAELLLRMSEVEMLQSDEASTCFGRNKVDTVFVFDESSLGEHDSQKIKNFTISILNDFSMDSGMGRVGLISKTCHEGDKMLGQYVMKQDLIAALHRREGPDISHLVKRARLEAFSPENGARFDAKHRLVIIINTEIKRRIEVAREVHRAKHTGIEVFIITHDANYDKSFFNRLASNKNYVMYLNSVDDLAKSDVQKTFLEKFCTDL